MARWTTLRDAKFRMHYALNPSSHFTWCISPSPVLRFFIWVLAPGFFEQYFLRLRPYHFGKDSSLLCQRNQYITKILFFLKGAAVIAAPLLLHRAETLDIFLILNLDLTANPLVDGEPDLGRGPGLELSGEHGAWPEEITRSSSAARFGCWLLSCSTSHYSHFSPSRFTTFVCCTPFTSFHDAGARGGSAGWLECLCARRHCHLRWW